MANKSQITIAAIALLVIIISGIFIFYKSSSRIETQKSAAVSSVSSTQVLSSSSQQSLSSVSVQSSAVLSSSSVTTSSKDQILVDEKLGQIENKAVEVSNQSSNNCDLNPDDYMDVIDLEDDCIGFSSKMMCDFDNNEPEIKQIKPQLYEIAEGLYDQYRSKVMDKNFFVNMSCQYIDENYFEFGLVIPDGQYYRKITGEISESMPVRFSNQYSATRVGSEWEIKLIKDTSFDFENPPKREPMKTPECLFPQQGNFRFQRIVQTEYGCYDFTIDPKTIDLSSKFQSDYFTFSLYDLEVISRDYFNSNYKNFLNEKAYIVAKNFKFTEESKLEFSVDLADSSAEAFQTTEYQKTFTLYKKRNGLWFTTK